MAHVRYLIYAEKAEAANFSSVARLFRAFAQSEYVVAAAHFGLLGELLSVHTVNATTPFTFERTMDNLVRSRDAEAEAAKEIYPPCLAVAESQDEEGAAKSFGHAAKISHRRAEMLEVVSLKARRADEEPCISDLFVCQACGNVMEAPLSAACAVCEAGRDNIRLVE
jgi:rubrerythrin